MEKKIHLNGYMDVPEDRIEDVSAALVEHINLTHAEDGCISFKVTPCADIKGRFWVAETFRDRSAFDRHQERSSKSHWASITKGMPRIYEISEE